MDGKVLKNVVKRFMVLVLVITLATCNTGTGFSLVKAEEIVETKEKTEVGSNVNNEGYCEPEVVEEIVSDRTTDSTTFLLSNGMKQLIIQMTFILKMKKVSYLSMIMNL